MRHHLDQMAETEVEHSGQRQHSSDEEDFFSTMKSRRSKGSGELEGYLACVSENMDLLNSFPNIKKLSLKLNTDLPASAACEHLFTLLVCSQRREHGLALQNLKINSCSN